MQRFCFIGTFVLDLNSILPESSINKLTDAQNELYEWIKEFMRSYKHSPSIRQMMQAMDLKSPAPIQSRLKHLQDKGYLTWQEGKARTLKIIDEVFDNGIPILGSIAAGGLVETFSDISENVDISEVLKKRDIFALTVNGDSMIDACIADGDLVLMEPLNDFNNLRNGTIVSALVPGSGTTLKYFFRKNNQITLEAANSNYEPIKVEPNNLTIQGKLVAVWRKA